MSSKLNGELVPEGGGDNIPLIRDVLTIGRRDSCDIPLRLPNVSGMHCELSYQDGLWSIRDLGSTNGTKVNGVRVTTKLLQPGEKITIGKKTYTIEYDLPAGKRGVSEMPERQEEDVLSQSLLERAGLVQQKRDDRRGKRGAADPFKFLEGDEDAER